MNLASVLIRMHTGLITDRVFTVLQDRDDQRDLSVSYERMGALSDQTQEQRQAAEWFAKALAYRQALTAQEPQRIDLAQELAVCLYLVARSDPSRLEDIKCELIDLLSPFEVTGTITAQAAAILRWPRE